MIEARRPYPSPTPFPARLRAGFDLVAALGLADSEPFAGVASECAQEACADLCGGSAAEPPPPRWSFRLIESALRLCLARCEGLRSRGDAAVASASGAAAYQVIALIEHLVHEVLPFPAPASPGEGLLGDARAFEWIPAPEDAPFSAASQGAVVRLFAEAARLYGDAAARVGGSRPLFGARVVTLAALAVLVDATARVTAVVGDASALAAVLGGGGSGGGGGGVASSAAAAASAGAPAGGGAEASVAYGLSLVSNASLSFEDLTATLLLTHPRLLRTRAAILRYLGEVR